MLTLMHSTRTFYKPPRYGSPGIRRYDARVSGQKLLASRGLAQTCADLRDLLKENNFVELFRASTRDRMHPSSAGGVPATSKYDVQSFVPHRDPVSNSTPPLYQTG